MTKIKKFQEGAIIDEDTLFNDDEPDTGAAGDAGALDGELAGQEGPEGGPGPEGVEKGDEGDEGDGAAAAGDESDYAELSGVEQFLTQYGVTGGVITYEDGATARFSDLDPGEQANILSSLVTESVPSIEEKFNLDEDEINLLNAVRDSSLNSEEFINSIVDHRLQTVIASRDADNTDYANLSGDAIFVKNLRDLNPEITDEAVAEELVKAKELSSFNSTTETMRKLYISEQEVANSTAQAERDAIFNDEIEAQRRDIVGTVEGIDDIAGAAVSPEMKEFLLHDIMELNDDKDPILMEKIFSDPQTMFEANWFVNYGKDYISQLNNYWKKEVSRAHKTGYEQATGRMPGNPTIIGEDGKAIPNTGTKKSNQEAPLPGQFGKIVSEEELFNE